MPKDKNKPKDKEAIRLRMADLCSRSEQCEADLRKKILTAGLPSSDADEIILFLKERKFLDNARFAHAFATDKVRFAGWGKLKIRAALAAKRVDSSDISAALNSIDESDYLSAIRKAGMAKAKGLDLEDMAQRAKLFRFLASRGFESTLISQLIEALRLQKE